MADKRKSLRKNLMAFTSVYGLRPKTLLGYIEDLTVHGARVVGEKTVEINKQLAVGIEFPRDAYEETVPRIVVSARVVWCRKDKNPNYFDIGLEFTELTPENERVIEDILRKYEIHRKTAVLDEE